MYYLCSENKGADQLHVYCAADLCLCFRIYAKSRFSHDAAHIMDVYQMHKSNPKFRHLAFCMTVYACLKNKFTRLESAIALLKYPVVA